MSSTTAASAAPRYAFLSKPPPAQKPAPANVPLPSPPAGAKPPATRRRSSTFSAITAWAQTVQPGSPSSPPLSPHNKRRRSISRRRPSITANHSKTGSFLNISTPTTASRSPFTAKSFDSKAEASFDLTDLGYTSVFVNLPYTPTTPSPYVQPRTGAPAGAIPVPPIPESPIISKPPKTIKRFRSLSILKPMPRSSNKSTTSSTEAPSDSKISKKSSKQAKVKAKPTQPPTLYSELQLSQFLGGGKMTTHVEAMMEKRAKEIAPAKTSKSAYKENVEGVYRDENGFIWADEAEKHERAYLLASPASPKWESFSASTSPSSFGFGVERRGSETSASSVLGGRKTEVSLMEDVTMAGIDVRSRDFMALPPPPRSVRGKERKVRPRPAPLQLAPVHSVSAQAVPGFDDVFNPNPTSAGPLSAPIESRQNGHSISHGWKSKASISKTLGLKKNPSIGKLLFGSKN